jgi:hypothetical protein
MNKVSDEDMKRMKKAEAIVPFTQTEAWINYVRPYLINLSQSGYPDPSTYQTNEKLILDYTKKCGETEACKKIIIEIESQTSIMDAIHKKYSEDKKQPFEIGGADKVKG